MDLTALSIPGTRITVPPDAMEEMLAGFKRVLESERLILGDETARFEQACAATVGTTHAVAVSSGTAALEIIFRALGVAGRSVLIPANTFFATAIAVIRAGGEPVLADVGSDLLLDVARLEDAWRADTCGVVVVHIGGMISPDLEAILDFAQNRGGFVVEDAAQAFGSTCPLGAAGGIGRAGATSFYPTKIVTAGEGGVITTDDASIARAAIVLRDQGKRSFGENVHIAEGYSWRLSELHAVVGCTQVSLLADTIARKRRLARIYDEQLATSPLRTVVEPPGHAWNRYKYVAVLPAGIHRDEVRARLASQRIGLSGEVFALPLNLQPVFEQRFGRYPMPGAEEACERHVCLPISADLTDCDAARVATAVAEAVDGAHDPVLRRR